MNRSLFLCSSLISLSSVVATPALATVYEFHFTGQYTLIDPAGAVMDRQPIESTLTYDDTAGSGFSADLSIANFDTLGATATIYDVSLQRYGNTNLIVGNMLADWNVNVGIPLSMVWDATGLFNAIDYGLQVGDVISGTFLKRAGQSDYDVNSTLPANEGLPYWDPLIGTTTLSQGPAPLAMTTLNTSTLCSPGFDCIGSSVTGDGPFYNDGISGSPMIDGPFQGINVNFDIGSGNSLTVTSISTVPVPAAIWLFGSGLLGLVGMARRKAA